MYGVLSLHVRQRVPEIGLRQALGADRGKVTRGVVGTGLGLAAVGGGIGIGAALGLSRFVDGLLFGVAATDPVVYVVTPLVLASVALLA